jgi:uncharacterized protein (TIGR03435 family)
MLCSLTVSNWSATWKRGSCLVYAMVAAKGGPRLQPSKFNGSTIDSSNNRIDIRGGGNTCSTLAAELSKRLGRVVIDKTGIAGRYDVVLSRSPDVAKARA